MSLLEADISCSVDPELLDGNGDCVISVDANDIVTALENNDEQILTFICQVLAKAGSSELRERLAERLGYTKMQGSHDGSLITYSPTAWDDEEYQ